MIFVGALFLLPNINRKLSVLQNSRDVHRFKNYFYHFSLQNTAKTSMLEEKVSRQVTCLTY